MFPSILIMALICMVASSLVYKDSLSLMRTFDTSKALILVFNCEFSAVIVFKMLTK